MGAILSVVRLGLHALRRLSQLLQPLGRQLPSELGSDMRSHSYTYIYRAGDDVDNKIMISDT